MSSNPLSVSDRTYFRIVCVLSAAVFGLVILLNRLPKAEHVPGFVYMLPAVNACINGTCSLLLLLSLYFIRRKDIATHKRINIITFVLSSIFLLSYVTFHYFAEETRFPTEHPFRPLYLFILATHIVLAAAVLPLVLLSFYHGLKLNVATHKKLVRWTWPIWLYVTITGVVVYLMISPYYPF